jgi:hypothetical protein
MLEEFALTPYICVMVIQPFQYIRTLLLYLPHMVVVLVSCEALRCHPHILRKQMPFIIFLRVLPQVPHAFSMFYSRQDHVYCHSQSFSYMTI